MEKSRCKARLLDLHRKYRNRVNYRESDWHLHLQITSSKNLHSCYVPLQVLRQCTAGAAWSGSALPRY